MKFRFDMRHPSGIRYLYEFIAGSEQQAKEFYTILMEQRAKSMVGPVIIEDYDTKVIIPRDIFDGSLLIIEPVVEVKENGRSNEKTS